MKFALPLAAAFLLAAGPAIAQQSSCPPYDIVAAALLEKLHQAPVARGLSRRGYIIEILAAGDGGSFTVLGIQSGGTACVLAVGDTWTLIEPENAAPTLPGSPS